MKKTAMLSNKCSQYYAVAGHWASDLEFFKVESIFFYYLLEKYAVTFSSSSYLEKLKALGKELKVLDEERQKIEVLIYEQFELIVLVAKHVVPENLEKIEMSQTTLEILMKKFINQSRELKKKLFNTVKNMIDCSS